MIFTPPNRPVSRARVLLGALIMLGALVGLIVLSEALRHPYAGIEAMVPPAEGDFRDEVVCPPDLPPEEDADAQGPGSAVPVSSDRLYDCPAVYDGQLVRYEGEVVGALMHRGDGAWTQLNDDVYAGELGPLPGHRVHRGGNTGVGVYLPADVAERVGTVGGPKARGDILAVIGTFHRIDPGSREAAVIRAHTGTVERPGQPIEHEPLRNRRAAGIILALAATGLTAAHRIAIRRQPLRELPRARGTP